MKRAQIPPGLTAFYTLNSLTAAALTHLRLHSEGGTISSGSAFAFYAVKRKSAAPEIRGAAVHDRDVFNQN